MKNLITAIIFVAIIAGIFFFLGKGCSEEKDTDITPILEILEQNKKDIAKIDSNMVLFSMKQDSINHQRVLHQTFNKYEITKMDSLIALDSTNVNAIIRARLQALSQLPGFYDISSNPKGIRKDTIGSTGW